jgi:hypothetical protein
MRRTEQAIIGVAWCVFGIGLAVGVVGLLAGYFKFGPGILVALMPVGFIVASVGVVFAMGVDQRSTNRRLAKSGVRGYAIVRDCRQHPHHEVENSSELELLVDLILGGRPPVTYRYTGLVPVSEIQRLSRLDRVGCVADPAKPDVIRIFPWDNPDATGGTGRYLQLAGVPATPTQVGPSVSELLSTGHPGVAEVRTASPTGQAAGDGTPVFRLELAVTPRDGSRPYLTTVDQPVPGGRINPGSRLRCAYDPAARAAVAVDLNALVD